MPFARIVDAHIPMKGTALNFQCMDYQVPFFRHKWRKHKERDESQPMSFTPLPLDGERDPLRWVKGDPDRAWDFEQKYHGKKVVTEVMNFTQFETAFQAALVPKNDWKERRDRERMEEESKRDAAKAVATGQQIVQAVEALNNPSRGQRRPKQNAELAESQQLPEPDAPASEAPKAKPTPKAPAKRGRPRRTQLAGT